MAVISGRFAPFPLLCRHLLEPLLAAEAGIGVAMLDQPVGVLLVEGQPLALNVGADAAADLRTFIPIEPKPA